MANRFGTFAAIGGVAVVAVFAFVAFRPQPSDQALIEQALKDAIEASKEGRPGSVLEHLSESFEINGSQIMNRTEVARFIRESKPDVTVESTVADVEGDSAVIKSPVKLAMSGPFKLETTIPDVKIEFRKEQTMRFFVIPGRDWKLYRVEVPAESWARMALGY